MTGLTTWPFKGPTEKSEKVRFYSLTGHKKAPNRGGVEPDAGQWGSGTPILGTKPKTALDVRQADREYLSSYPAPEKILA